MAIPKQPTQVLKLVPKEVNPSAITSAHSDLLLVEPSHQPSEECI